MSTFNVVIVESLRQLVLQILTDGVTAAKVVDPAPPAWLLPLKDLYLPKHRFEKLDPKRAPFAHVVGKSDGGAGQSHELPRIDSRAVLHVNLLCACGRDDASDLDGQAGLLAEAICLQILEDQRFLKAVRWVEALRITNEDGIVRGDAGGGEYDVVLIQIEIEVAVGAVRFEPRDDGPTIATTTIGANIDPEAVPIAGQSNVVKAEFAIPIPDDD